MGQQQLLLLVLTTIIIGLATVAGIDAYQQGQRQAAIDHMAQKAIEIAADVQIYAHRSDLYRSKSLYSIEGSQTKMSAARRLQGARSRQCGASAIQRNAEGGVQGHLQPFPSV